MICDHLLSLFAKKSNEDKQRVKDLIQDEINKAIKKVRLAITYKVGYYKIVKKGDGGENEAVTVRQTYDRSSQKQGTVSHGLNVYIDVIMVIGDRIRGRIRDVSDDAMQMSKHPMYPDCWISLASTDGRKVWVEAVGNP